MASIAEIRAQYPEQTRNLSNLDVVREFARVNNLAVDVAAATLGEPWTDYTRDDPGFSTAFQNSLYGLGNFAGAVVRDATGYEGLSDAMQMGLYRNPVTLTEGASDSAFENAVTNLTTDPLGSMSQVAGMMAGLAVPGKVAQLGARAAGLGAIGEEAAMMAAYGGPSAGQFRDNSIATGRDSFVDMLADYGMAAGIGKIESSFGPEAILARGRMAPFVEGAGRNFAVTGLKTGAFEAGEELMQAPLEQLGMRHNPFTLETLDQGAAGALFGFAGGVPVGIAMHPLMKRQETDLLNRGEPDISGSTYPQAYSTADWINRNTSLTSRSGVTKADAQAAFGATDRLSGHFDPETGTELTYDEYVNRAIAERENSRYGIRDMFTGAVSTPVYFQDAAENDQDLSGYLRRVRATHLDMFPADPVGGLHSRVPVFNPATGEIVYVGDRPESGPEQPTATGFDPNASAAFTQPPITDTLVGARELAEKRARETTAQSQQNPSASVTVGERNGKRRDIENAATVAGLTNAQHDEVSALLDKREYGNAARLVENFAALNARAPSTATTVTPAASAAGVSTTTVPSAVALPQGQQRVFDVLVSAMQNNDMDRFIMTVGRKKKDGTSGRGFNYAAIAEAAGINSRQAAYAAVNQALQKIAVANGFASADALKTYLMDTKNGKRKVEAHDYDRLGLPPAEQVSVVDQEELFGDNQSFGLLESVGSSQSETGEDKLATALAAQQPDPVADTRAAEARAKFEREQAARQRYVLQQPIAAEAAKMWDKWRLNMPNPSAVPVAAQLREQYAYEWVLAYAEWSNGSIDDDQIEADQQNIAELNQATSDEPSASVASTTDGGTIEGPQSASQREPVGRENGSEARALAGPSTARADAATEPAAEQTATDAGEGDGNAVTDETAEGDVEPKEVAVVRRLREIAKDESKSNKVRSSASWYLNEAKTGDMDIEVAAAFVQDQTDAERGVGKFSTSAAASGQKASGLRAALLKSFNAPYFFDRAVRVIQTQAELPPEALRSANGKRVAGYYDQGTKLVYIVADNVAQGMELSVLLHEVGVHKGMRNLLGTARYNKLIAKIKEWKTSGSGVAGALARKARERVNNAGTSKEDADEELLAYFVEEAVKAGINPTAVAKGGALQQWFRTLWAAVKAAVRLLGMNPDKLTAQHVVDLAYGAARMELNAAWHGTAAEFRRFDHNYMGTGEGAQAYGWGTYLAQLVGIGKEYWQADVRRKDILPGTEGHYTLKEAWKYTADATARAAAGQRAKGIKNAETSAGWVRYDGADWEQKEAFKWAVKNGFNLAALKKAKSELSEDAYYVYKEWHDDGASVEELPARPEGNLMRVDTSIQDEELLDWDKPLSEQSELVKKALDKAVTKVSGAEYVKDYMKAGFSGKDFYKTLQKELGSKQAASEYLDSIGIKGVKFLDQPSRNDTAKDWVNFPRWEELKSALKADDYLGFDRRNEAIAAAVEEGMPAMRNAYDMSPDTDALLSELLVWLQQPPERTHNLVVFNDKNIHRVFSEVGADPESRKFSGFDAPLWYSRAAAYIKQKAPNAALTAQKWMDNLGAWAKAGNIKADELKWSGVEDWLKAQPGVVHRNDLVAFLNVGGVQIEEKVLGAYNPAGNSTKYNRFTEPGAKEGSYREILLKLPVETKTTTKTTADAATLASSKARDAFKAEGGFGYDYYQDFIHDWTYEWTGELASYELAESLRKALLHTYKFSDEANAEAIADRLMQIMNDRFAGTERKPLHQATHYGDENENILATARINERTDVEGNRVLYIEEIQSDWAQDARKNPEGVAGAPFIGKTEQWAGLILKRLMRYAADNGFDKVAWSTGDQQFKRWGSERVSWKKTALEGKDQARFGATEGFVVSATEQTGGNVDGTNIEEMARARGELLEQSGQIIASKEDLRDTLRKILRRIMRRENNEQQIDAMTDKLLARMQTEPEGDFMPRREGMRGFYGDEQGRAPDGKPSWLANALKSLPAEIRPKLESVELGEHDGMLHGRNPGFTVDRTLADRPMPMFSIAEEASTPIPQETIFDKLAELIPSYKTLGLKWMTMHQIADRYQELKRVRDFVDTIVKTGKRRETIEMGYAKIQDRMVKLPKHMQTMLFERMIDSTLSGEFKETGLSAEAVAILHDAAAEFKKNWELRRKMLEDMGVTGLPTLKGPYFPLMRFGKYVVAWKSDAYKVAEAANDEEALARLKESESHYKVAFFDTLSAASRYGASLGVKPVLREEYVRNASVANAGFMKNLEEALASKLAERGEDGKPRITTEVREIIRSVQDVYAASLPDTSAMKREMKRQNVRGGLKASDMMRAFSLAATSDAFHIARLENSDALVDALYATKNESRETGSVEHQAVYNVLRQKYGLMMTRQEPTPIVDFLKNMSYINALGASPAFVAINATQPWLVTLPVLAARYGHRKAGGELKRSLGQATQLVFEMLKTSDVKEGFRYELDFDSAVAKRLIPDAKEREMLKAMLEYGQIDITIGTDLAAESKGGNISGRVMRWFTSMPHQIETVNRIGTALAAYRMASTDTARYAGKDIDAEARRYAYKTLYDTQIDYSNEAASVNMDSGRWGGIGKLMFQFRKYQQGMVYILVSNFKDAVLRSDLTPEEKKEARRALASMLTLSFAASGAAGSPLAMPIGIIASVISSAWPDDDEPEPEAWWRNFLTSAFGETGGLMAAKGIPAMLGGDASQRVGMGNVFNPAPFLEWRGSIKDSMKEYMAFGIAPAFGTLGKFYQALDAFGSHEYMKAASLASPKVLADAVKGFQLHSEGIKTKYGNTSISPEEFNAAEVLTQGLGLTPTKKSEYWDRQAIVGDREQAIKDARYKLIAEYIDAKKGGDVADVQLKINEFNQRHPNKPYRIDRSALLKSEEQRKRLQRTEGGIGYRKGEEWKAELTSW